MSIDRSLRTKASLSRHRNVLSRAERVARLKEHDAWSESMTVIGMRKVANRPVKAVGKKKKKGTEEEEAAT